MHHFVFNSTATAQLQIFIVINVLVAEVHINMYVHMYMYSKKQKIFLTGFKLNRIKSGHGTWHEFFNLSSLSQIPDDKGVMECTQYNTQTSSNK